MDPGGSPPDRLIGELAAVQQGAVSHRQLCAVGLGDGAIRHRVRAGRLYVVHKGVYAVGHPMLGVRGDWMAAVLALGEEALLSHSSAAALWGLTGRRPGPVHVSAPRSRRGHQGIRVHRPRSLHPDDRAVRDRIPVASVARTLLDVAGATDRRQLEKLFEEAIRLDLLDPAELGSLLDRTTGRRGAGALRRLLDEHLHLPDDTRPGIEAEFAAFLRARDLPLPAFNALVADYLVDAFWQAERVVAELQSRAFHSTWQARERDAERAGELQALGYRVLPITARRLREEPDALERTLRLLLGESGPPESGPAATPEPRRARPRVAA